MARRFLVALLLYMYIQFVMSFHLVCIESRLFGWFGLFCILTRTRTRIR